jgi:hypothetical protein
VFHCRKYDEKLKNPSVALFTIENSLASIPVSLAIIGKKVGLEIYLKLK